MKQIYLSKQDVAFLKLEGECTVDLGEGKSSTLLISMLPNLKETFSREVEDVVYLRGKTYKIGVGI